MTKIFLGWLGKYLRNNGAENIRLKRLQDSIAEKDAD